MYDMPHNRKRKGSLISKEFISNKEGGGDATLRLIKEFDEIQEVDTLNTGVNQTLNDCRGCLTRITAKEKEFREAKSQLLKSERELRKLIFVSDRYPETITEERVREYELHSQAKQKYKAIISGYEKGMKTLNQQFKSHAKHLKALEESYRKQYERHLNNITDLTRKDEYKLSIAMEFRVRELRKIMEVNEALVSFSEDISNGKYNGDNGAFGVRQDLLQGFSETLANYTDIRDLKKENSIDSEGLLQALNTLKAANRKKSNILFSAEENITKALERIERDQKRAPKTTSDVTLLRGDKNKQADIALAFIIAKAFDKPFPLHHDSTRALLKFAGDDKNIKHLKKKLNENLSRLNIPTKEKEKMKTILQNEIRALEELAKARLVKSKFGEHLKNINKKYSTSKVKNALIESMKLDILKTTLTRQKEFIVKEQACEFLLRRMLRKDIPAKFKTFTDEEKIGLLKSIDKKDFTAYVEKILGKDASKSLMKAINEIFAGQVDLHISDQNIGFILDKKNMVLREGDTLLAGELHEAFSPENFERRIENSLAQKTLISDTELESIHCGKVLDLTERILTNVTNSYTKSDAKKLQQALKTYKRFQDVLERDLTKNEWSTFVSGGKADWKTYGDKSIKTSFINAIKLIAQTVHEAKRQNGQSKTGDIEAFNKACDILIATNDQDTFQNEIKKLDLQNLFAQTFVDALGREASERVSEIGEEESKNIASLVINSLLFLLTAFLTVIGVNSLLTPTTSVTEGLTTAVNPDILTNLGTPIPPTPTINSSFLGMSQDIANKVAMGSLITGVTNRESNQSNHEAGMESKNDAISEASKTALMKMVNSSTENETMKKADIKVKSKKDKIPGMSFRGGRGMAMTGIQKIKDME